MRERQRLTKKQECFVQEYLKDLNATQAAIRAGYSQRNAPSVGPRLVRKSTVRAAIKAAMRQRSERTQVTVDAVLSELEPLAHSCITNYIIDDDGNLRLAEGAPLNAMRAVRSIKRRVFFDKQGKVTGRMLELTLWDKPKSLDLEGSHLGMWKQQFEVAHSAPLFQLPPGVRPDVSGFETRPFAERAAGGAGDD